jgi:hypothetical protein
MTLEFGWYCVTCSMKGLSTPVCPLADADDDHVLIKLVIREPEQLELDA